MTAVEFRAGAAVVNIDPPLGLPMIGVVRRSEPANGRVGSLEVTAVAFDRGGTRVVVCGVDTAILQSPEVDELRDRISDATKAARSGIIVNCNHTHHAPAGGRTTYDVLGFGDPEYREQAVAYIDRLHEQIVDACRLACERLEPAWVRCGLGFVDEAVNRRQRDSDGMVRRIGWNVSGFVDLSVPCLQAVRPDGSAIATVVAYGCHTVTTGIGLVAYSPDYPGPLRDLVRQVSGGECIFLQGAGGNVMPRVAFDDSLETRERLGRRLALEALHALADRPAQPTRLAPAGFDSATPLDLFRFEPINAEPPTLSAVEELVDFPLLPLPSLEEAERELARAEAEIREAEQRGASVSEIRVLRFHGAAYWERLRSELAGGSPRTSVRGSICAVRIGDCAIVTGPGEVFTEIGMAVKERSPADVTIYAGYTNGVISYMPIAAEYPLGGYEPGYGNKTYGLPTQVTPEVEPILVETGVRLVRSLFPERPPRGPSGWLASGAAPEAPPPIPLSPPT